MIMGKLRIRTEKAVSGLLVLVSLMLLSQPAQAATASTTNNGNAANGFLISPVRSEFTLDKGRSQTVIISIQNPTNVATVAKAIVNDFVASDDETGDPRLILDANTPPPSNDFRTLVGSIPDTPLGPQQKKDISVTVSVPTAAHAGGYYGAIRFVPSNNGKQSTVGLTASVGTLMLVTVPGNLVQKLTLTQLSAAQNNKASSMLFSGSVSVLTRLQNSGDIHLQPFGKVLVKDMFGKTVANYEFNNTNPRANILPSSIRRFVDPLPKRSWFGRYTIEENLAYSQGSGNLLTASAVFWYFPVWFIILFILIIALVVGLIYWLLWRKRHHSHHIVTPSR